ADELKQFQAMRKGDVSVAFSSEIIDRGAQWYAYRLTHTEYHETGTGAGHRAMHDLVKEALEQIQNPRAAGKRPTEAHLAFIAEFGKHFSGRLREVVKNPKPIS